MIKEDLLWHTHTHTQHDTHVSACFESVEGLIGAALASVATALLFVWLTRSLMDLPGCPELAPAEAAVFALGTWIFNITGDLSASFLKRVAAAKDSGALMPGHGGFLDKMDGLLGSFVWLFVFVCWLLPAWRGTA